MGKSWNARDDAAPRMSKKSARGARACRAIVERSAEGCAERWVKVRDTDAS